VLFKRPALGPETDRLLQEQQGNAKVASNSKISPKADWATSVFKFRQHLNLSQNAFGQRLHCTEWLYRDGSAALRNRCRRLHWAGNLAVPLCWYFWGRAGLRAEDLRRRHAEIRQALSRPHPQLSNRERGSGLKTSKAPQLVAIPLQEVVAASMANGGQLGDTSRRAS